MTIVEFLNLSSADLLSRETLSVLLLSTISLIVLALGLNDHRGSRAKLPPLVKYKARPPRVAPGAQMLIPPLSIAQWPILGSTFDFLKDQAGFTCAAYEKYGSVFRVYIRGHVQAVVGKEHVRDIFLNPAFNFEEAVKDEYNLAEMIGTAQTRLEPHRLLAAILTPHVARFVPILSGVLTRGFDVGVGADLAAPRRVDNPPALVMDVLARATTVCFFGEELGTNAELIPVYQDFASSIGHFVARKSPMLALLPRVAKFWIWVKFNFYSPTAAYRETLLKHAMPIVHERRRQMAELGEEYERPVDSLQAYLNTVPPDEPVDEMELGTIMLVLIFFSIHTTTKRAIVCLYNLAKYPQFIEALLEEQEDVLGRDWADGSVGLDQLQRLVKLDSFIRECLRTSNRSIALPHKIVGMDGWELPGGYVLPKGTVVNINAEDLYYAPELQGPNPREFNAWRFVGTDKVASRIGPDMIVFGLGRHACPGRFFAVHELKLFVSLILKRYRVSFPPGAKPGDSGPLVFAPVGAAP
ncbi:uncharacterized protein FIBRA_05560 [Fibroporia radiculosa]|uniref:Cytochrome P450 n=1 Tax=Fibroporia radiculosa TaxID=599839 RepID=J4H3L0_9APHY|nr:uncharacterized protein FIBRA_05560 [Fibroporia radiculosa]CCM03429.1 predicted protein [Fibroporia radiculosa]